MSTVQGGGKPNLFWNWFGLGDKFDYATGGDRWHEYL